MCMLNMNKHQQTVVNNELSSLYFVAHDNVYKWVIDELGMFYNVYVKHEQTSTDSRK